MSQPHVTGLSLRAKLALLLAGLFLLAGVGVLIVAATGAGQYSAEVNHRLNREIAAHIAGTIDPFVGDQVNKDALKGVFMDVMVVNPTLEVYLVGPTGDVLAYDAPEEKILRRRVDLAPVEAYLASGGTELKWGDDPRSTDRKKPISAHAIREEDTGLLRGYLYIILGGEDFDGITHVLQQSYAIRWGTASILASFLIAAIVGLLALRQLTRPLEELRLGMQEFHERGSTRPLPVTSRDEIGALTVDFNEMASRIAEQVELLRSTDEDRRAFVANISHDLRTPTAAVQGYLETLLLKASGLDEDERKAYLERAASQAERLNGLVEQLFELARLEARDVAPELEPFDLAGLAGDALAKFQSRADKVRVTLAIDPDASQGDLDVVGDVALIERLIDNLVSNAMRFCRSQVVLKLTRNGRKVILRVVDDGPGIAAEDGERIFERFYRGSRPGPGSVGTGSKAGQGGTGLGLAIVARIAVLHGAKARVAATGPKGTILEVVLPAAQGA
ncbi:MAG: HAMP domain-containing sensor histidine kinase [Planctomycetota bacterium]|nr:HAMP domain-containing sensor histidine kinase [Planctomycetota bacterium]